MDEPTETEESETIAKILRRVDDISQRVSQIFFFQKLDFSQKHRKKKKLVVRFERSFGF